MRENWPIQLLYCVNKATSMQVNYLRRRVLVSLFVCCESLTLCELLDHARENELFLNENKRDRFTNVIPVFIMSLPSQSRVLHLHDMIVDSVMKTRNCVRLVSLHFNNIGVFSSGVECKCRMLVLRNSSSAMLCFCSSRVCKTTKVD